MNAATAQKAPREYRMHGDCRRIRRLKEAGIDAIDARSRPGRESKAWRAEKLIEHGGKGCPRGVREMINEATFMLWRKLCLREHIAADAKRRGTVVNRRTGRLPKVHEQYDAMAARFDAITEALKLEKTKEPNPFGGGFD